MWVTTRELLQFIGIQNFDGNFGPSRNNEDNFVDITGITEILSKDTVPENSLLPYENNKKWVKQYQQCQ